MKALTLEKKEVHYKLRCIEEAGYDITVGKIYDCFAEGFAPGEKEVFMCQIIDDAGDEHAVLPELFERVK